MEDGHPGVPCFRHSEHRHIDQVRKETDEGGSRYPLDDFGPDSVGAHPAVSRFAEETSIGRKFYDPWFSPSGGRLMIPPSQGQFGQQAVKG